MGLRLVGLDADVEEEALAVFCLALLLALGAGFDADDDGPALVDGARLGGLKGRRRFFAGWGSPAIVSLVEVG